MLTSGCASVRKPVATTTTPAMFIKVFRLLCIRNKLNCVCLRNSTTLSTQTTVRRTKTPFDAHQFFAAVAKQLGFDPVVDKERWYDVQQKDIFQIPRYNDVNKLGGWRRCLLATYPNLGLETDRFNKWKNNMTRQRQFFDSFAKSKGFHPTDQPLMWNSVSYAEIKLQGGDSLVEKYKGFRRAIKATYPEARLDPVLFCDDINYKAFFDRVARTKAFHPTQEKEMWFSVSREDILGQEDGDLVLRKAGGLKGGLVRAYPGLDIRFKNSWKNNLEKQRNFFEQVALKVKGFDIHQEPHRLHSITVDDVINYKHGKYLLRHYGGSLVNALNSVFPEHPPMKNFQKNQILLHKVVELLFDTTKHPMILNARKEAGIVKSEIGKKVIYYEIDVWMPSLTLGFEYQDAHHYVDSWFSNFSLAKFKKDDLAKREVMGKMNRTLIEVPCWWDGRKESLAATIRQVRPDLLSDYVDDVTPPISTAPPPNFFKVHQIPDVGLLMLASFFHPPSFVLDNWWMGEKFDGTRICWHPQNKELYSRFARPVLVPPEFKAVLPTVFIDGELWVGMEFKQLASLYREISNRERFPWHFLRIVAFDVPSPEFQREKVLFEKRYSFLLLSLPRAPWFAVPVPRIVCVDSAFMKYYAKVISARGGEGIMLRKSSSIYGNGRSADLIKHKKISDAEALIVEKAGVDYLCQLPSGEIFMARRAQGAKSVFLVGNVVTFKYSEMSAEGFPLQPSIYRTRSDLTWNDVIQSYFSSR